MNTYKQSPYEVLGLFGKDFTVDDIKKNYQRLVRENPPEQKPDEFMKIRDAYDTITKGFTSSIVFFYKDIAPEVVEKEEKKATSNTFLKEYFEVPFSIEVELNQYINHTVFKK